MTTHKSYRSCSCLLLCVFDHRLFQLDLGIECSRSVDPNMLSLVVAAIALYLLYSWLNQKPKNFPPGPPTFPIIGSLPYVESVNFQFYLEKAKKQYGPIIGFMFGRNPAVAICGIDEVIEVFKRDEFVARPSVTINNRRAAGVFFSNGQHWKEQRRFTLRHLRDFGFGKRTVVDLIHAEVDEFCEKKLKDTKNVEISNLFTTSAVNIIWAMIAGDRLHYGDKNMEKLMYNLQLLFRNGNVVGGLSLFPVVRKLISMFYTLADDKVDHELDSYFISVIKEHAATRTETPRDFIDVYLAELEDPAHKASFTSATLVEVIRDFFGAGGESSSNSVSFAIMYLLLYPEWQEKLIKEIDAVLQGNFPQIEDIKNLPTVEAFLTEVQRSNTIAPISVPRATTKQVEFRGYTLPENTLIQLSIWSMMQDDKHWGDPKNFRPERFLDENGKFIKDVVIANAFGAGARKCPGETLAQNFIFLVFISMLQRYKFTLPKNANPPDTTCVSGFTTAPQTFYADLTPR